MTTTLSPPQRRWIAAVAGVALVAGTLALTLPASTAGADPDPIATETLTTLGVHNAFTDDVAAQVRDKPDGRSTEVVNLRDASSMAVFEFTIQPDAWFPWHTHPGVVLAAVAAGDLVFIYADDCVERPYGQGEAFVDPGIVHTAYNPSSTTETVVVATVLGVDSGAPPATAIDPDEAEALNEACGTDALIPPPADTSHDDH